MLEEVVWAVYDFDAINKLVILSPGEPDNYNFVFAAFEVVKDC
jgi:hypothetical protein